MNKKLDERQRVSCTVHKKLKNAKESCSKNTWETKRVHKLLIPNKTQELND